VRIRWRRLAPIPLAAFLLGCDAGLPETESRGARLYAERCNGCHRLYAPGSMKAPLWEFTLQRMQGEMARRGVPPLTSEEYETIKTYLERHSDR
jgi:mono/diheme cytochrome c family protein